MANQTRLELLGLCVIASLALTGCPSDDDGGTEEVGETMGTDTTGETGDTTTTTTTDETADTVDTVDTVDTADTTDTTTGELPDPFVFAEDPAGSYSRVDRMGMPAIATAVITNKDAYNAANPVDDVATDFVDEITINVSALHTALNDDLDALGLTPCLAAVCVLGQAASLVVPDTLKIDLTADAGFPNGRRLQDPVIDVTLAVVLLDLNVHGVTLFADLPLNPPANDVPFLAEFPFLADPN